MRMRIPLSTTIGGGVCRQRGNTSLAH
jgi:hypothetical protein